MHGLGLLLSLSTSSNVLTKPFSSHPNLYPKTQIPLSTTTCKSCYKCSNSNVLVLGNSPSCRDLGRKRRGSVFRTRVVCASRRDSPYEVLGVSPSADAGEIKRAYRRLALKFHPDVNKEVNAQEKFMRIKHAYNTLLNSSTQRKSDTGSRASNNKSSDGTYKRSEDEEFYGLGDFFRDLQEEFNNWEATASSQAKPKSLWEELAEIGEEFVEFLEKELNITYDEENRYSENREGGGANYATKGTGSSNAKEAEKGGSIEENIDDIEAALAQLKKDLGL